MTRAEAIKRLKEIDIRDALQEDYDTLGMAIKALEQDILDEIIEIINTPNRGTCDYFIVDRIEEIIEKYRQEG